MGVLWPTRRIVGFILASLPPPRDMVEGKWRVSNNSTRGNIPSLNVGVASENIHVRRFTLVSGGPWQRPTEAQPRLIHHANDDGFPPLCHLITSCPGFYQHFPGQSRPPPTSAHEGLFSYSVSPRTKPIKELIHLPSLSTPLITNSAESGTNRTKDRFIYLRT